MQPEPCPRAASANQHAYRPPAVPEQITTDGGARAFDAVAIRRDFPALNQQVHGQPLVWLDNAATTHKPQSVIDALANYYARDNSNIHRAAHTLAARSTDAYEQARERVQKFIGASSTKEIIFVRGTTEGNRPLPRQDVRQAVPAAGRRNRACLRSSIMPTSFPGRWSPRKKGP